jgi:hypothetical protein
MEHMQISVKLLNQVLGYLGNRPYTEVFQLIEALQLEAKNQPQADQEERPGE